MNLLVLILFVILIAGAPPLGLHTYGYYPSGGAGLVLLIVVLVLLLGGGCRQGPPL